MLGKLENPISKKNPNLPMEVSEIKCKQENEFKLKQSKSIHTNTPLFFSSLWCKFVSQICSTNLPYDYTEILKIVVDDY